MTEAFMETPAERASSRGQLIAALLLGIAATFTAICAYQAALTDGAALQGYTKSTRTLNDANGYYTQGNQTIAQDQELFVAYASANQEGNADLAEYLMKLMRPDLAAAVTWWQEHEEVDTPMADVAGNPYTVSDYDEAEDLEDEAARLFRSAAKADDRGDKFQLATVLFSVTLFAGGIAPAFRRRRVVLGLLGVAASSLALGSIQFAVALI